MRPPPPSPPPFRRPGPGRRAGGAASSPAPVRARRLPEAGPDRVATMSAPPPPPSPGRRAGGAAGLAAPPRTRSGRIVSGRPGRIGGRRRRRRRRRPSDGPGRVARPAVPRAPHRSGRVGSRACLIGPSFACPAQQQGKPLCFYFPAPRCGGSRLPLLVAPAPGPSLQRHRFPLLPAPPGIGGAAGVGGSWERGRRSGGAGMAGGGGGDEGVGYRWRRRALAPIVAAVAPALIIYCNKSQTG